MYILLSFRIHLEEQGFEGNPVELRFTYDGSGLAPGHVEQESLRLYVMVENLR